MTDQWNSDLYDNKHSFVWKFGASVIELLAPQPGERILDVGCGTGALTAQIAATPADVVGFDSSPSMIEQAQESHPTLNFVLADAHDFQFDEPFDAVFSNAALHWIKEPSKVVRCIASALNLGGRLAVEFGGFGNVHFVTSAIELASEEVLGQRVSHPWYFPTIVDFASHCEANGLEVTQAALIDRPTALDGADGLRNWVRMFGGHWLSRIAQDQHETFLDHVDDHARSKLFRDSVWHADYRRIRVLATKR
jgi:trans-aconitate methyltransferase